MPAGAVATRRRAFFPLEAIGPPLKRTMALSPGVFEAPSAWEASIRLKRSLCKIPDGIEADLNRC